MAPAMLLPSILNSVYGICPVCVSEVQPNNFL